MKILLKCSLLIILTLVLIHSIKIRAVDDFKAEDDDEYGEELNSVVEAWNQNNKLYLNKKRHTNFFSKIYMKADEAEITRHTADLMKADQSSFKAFYKLNAIASNTLGGTEKLKNNGGLKSTLKAMLNDPTMKIVHRVNAAKLAARLNNIPVSIQMTSDKDVNRKQKNDDTWIAVPRISRIYRPDRYVEEYKAGNWDA